MDSTSNSMQQGRIGQTVNEVHHLLQWLRILTDACQKLDGLQKLRRILIEVCYDFSNQ